MIFKIEDKMEDYTVSENITPMCGIDNEGYILVKDGKKFFSKYTSKNMDGFKNEIKINGMLNDRFIKLKSWKHYKDGIVLIYPYVDRSDLYKHLEKVKDISEVLQIMRNILEDVKYLKSKNILHGDLKCENILYDGKGRPTIIDFDGAIVLKSDEEWTQKKDYDLLASVPELDSFGEGTPEKITVYQLGQIFDDMMQSVIEYRPHHGIERLISRMRSKFPSQRPTLEEVINHKIFQCKNISKKD
jgi:serine/threonine protein kinase